jgi:hypothetical protein
MISLRQVRKILLTIALVFFISTAIAVSVGSEPSWAVDSFTPSVDRLHREMAMMGQNRDKAGNSKTQAAEKTKQLEAKTGKAINNSIENPKYQPGGQTKQAEKQTRETREGIQSQVQDTFKN